MQTYINSMIIKAVKISEKKVLMLVVMSLTMNMQYKLFDDEGFSGSCRLVLIKTVKMMAKIMIVLTMIIKCDHKNCGLCKPNTSRFSFTGFLLNLNKSESA